MDLFPSHHLDFLWNLEFPESILNPMRSTKANSILFLPASEKRVHQNYKGLRPSSGNRLPIPHSPLFFFFFLPRQSKETIQLHLRLRLRRNPQPRRIHVPLRPRQRRDGSRAGKTRRGEPDDPARQHGPAGGGGLDGPQRDLALRPARGFHQGCAGADALPCLEGWV